jgi:hypothetical protein
MDLEKMSFKTLLPLRSEDFYPLKILLQLAGIVESTIFLYWIE